MADLEKTVAIIFSGKDELSTTVRSISRSFSDFSDITKSVASPLSKHRRRRFGCWCRIRGDGRRGHCPCDPGSRRLRGFLPGNSDPDRCTAGRRREGELIRMTDDLFLAIMTATAAVHSAAEAIGRVADRLETLPRSTPRKALPSRKTKPAPTVSSGGLHPVLTLIASCYEND